MTGRLATTLAAVLCVAAPAGGQPAPDRVSCGQTAGLRDELARRWGEELVATGILPGGQAMLLFGNAASGSWTLALASPAGVACVIWSGGGLVAPGAPGRGA